VPRAGDFRVQPQHGGLLEAAGSHGRGRRAGPGRSSLRHLATITYARVDMIRAQDGRLALMELEAIEPDLYFRCFAPEGGRNFGEAVLRRAIDQGCDKSS
jgi:hypothetical protein